MIASARRERRHLGEAVVGPPPAASFRIPMICVSPKFDFPMTASDSKQSAASCLFVREAYVASYDRPVKQFVDVDALSKIDESCASESKLVLVELGSARYSPQSPLTIVPLALALGALMQSAEAAILVAANVGGDSDSVASIAGAVLGARFPESVNGEWYAVVESVNRHDLGSIARDLSAIRR